MLLSMLLSMLLALSMNGAAAPAVHVSSRSFAEMVDFVMRNGVERPLEAPVTTNLGLPSIVPTKAIRYKDSVTPDKKEHALFVVLSSATMKPTDLVIVVAHRTITKEGKYVEGYNLRLTLAGALREASKYSGKVGKVQQESAKPGAKDVKNAFDHEIQFFLKDAVEKKIEASGR